MHISRRLNLNKGLSLSYINKITYLFVRLRVEGNRLKLIDLLQTCNNT